MSRRESGPSRRGATLGLVLAVLLATAMALGAPPAAPRAEAKDFQRDWQAWHRERIERLKAESGWLTLVGLHWLSPGENRFGSEPSLAVPLPSGRAPLRAGTLTVDGRTVRVTADAGSGLTINGGPIQPGVSRELKTDADGAPDILMIGTLAFHVIRRGDRLGVRVKDPESQVRRDFTGIDTFPAATRWRITAAFVPYPKPKEIEIPTVLGTVEKMQAPGVVKFRVDGQELSLEPVIEDPLDPSLFFIFRDRTSGRETYGSGRFLDADMPKDGKVVLDFNRATNPPCAFTPYATCPLPPKSNSLPIRIEAGEKAWHGKGAPEH